MKKGVLLATVIFFTIGGFSQEIQFRLNQIGYRPNDIKEAILFSSKKLKGSINLLNSSGTTVEKFKPTLSNKDSWGGFKYYYKLDLSGIKDPGEYYLVHERSKNKSRKFSISSDAYAGIEQDFLAFMQQQRCGYNPFLDIVCHKKDGRSMYGPMPDSTFVDVSGGWHDAGDQLKYLITGSYATAHMLLAYNLYSDTFSDRVNELGQVGSNGLPDILDEAKWGLDWIMKMHPAEEQLFHQVADDRDHLGWKWPDDDPSDYGWGPNSYRVAYFANGQPQGLNKYKSKATGVSNVAGRSAAALALGYRVFMDIDEAYALKCLEKAKSIYSLGKQKEGFQQGNSYGAPYRYNETTWTDDMEWGAAELYKATGEKTYLLDGIDYATKANIQTSWLERDSMSHYELYPFINIGHFALYESVGNEEKSKLADYYRSGIERTLARANTNHFEIGVPFIWCSNNLLAALITQIILYEEMTGDMRYHHYLIKQRDWLFGRNPWGTSMFTGIPGDGEYPKDVHTSVYALTREVVPGGLIDGPVYSSIYGLLEGLTLEDPDEFAEFQNRHVVYHDDVGDYSTNEPTMDGTASSFILIGYFASDE